MLSIAHYQGNVHKTTMRYHLTLIRMAIIKKSTNNKCWKGCGEKGTLLPCWWECKLIQTLCMTVWRVLKKKTRNKTTIRLNNPTTGHFPEETTIEKGTSSPISLHHYLQQLGHGSNLYFLLPQPPIPLSTWSCQSPCTQASAPPPHLALIRTKPSPSGQPQELNLSGRPTCRGGNKNHS